MEEDNKSKRPRDIVSDTEGLEPLTKTKHPPSYGSQEYWEHRYNKNFKDGTDAKTKKESSEVSVETPEAYHSWYFNYTELSPIILPLILGDEGEDEEIVEAEGGSDEEVPPGEAPDEIEKSNSYELESNSNEENLLEIEEQISDYDELAEFEVDDEEDAPKRVGLAKDGAISILEVGCGDAPLGRDLAKGIQQLESATGVAASNILKRVVCIDYARTVIDSMKKEQEKEKTESSKKPQAVPVVYEVGDARKLSYSDSSFELILEKGTLDAMLSDTTIGTENCRLIVAECGRLLSIGGCLLIVSHLNAHVDSGLQWLDQIVVPGLRMSGGLYKWEIEVHGNSVDIPPALDENEKEEELPESPGPAVYIINKGEAAPKANEMEEKETEDDLPTIPLRFFSY